MPTTLKVRNYRGAASADVLIHGITLIGGPNGAGKSSVISAAQAVLTGNPLTGDGVKHKNAADGLLRRGANDGSAVLESDGGSTAVYWPGCTVEGQGRPLGASVYAAGMVSLVDLSMEERAKTLAEYLKGSPKKDDLLKAAAAAGIKPKAAEAIWAEIEAKGWDGATEAFKTDAAAAKREWERLCGSRYGAVKAATWTPQGWHDGLHGADAGPMAQMVVERRAQLEESIAAAALSGARVDELKKTAAALPEREKVAKNAAAAVEAAKAIRDKVWDELDALPKPPESSLPCPHCGGLINLSTAAGVTKLVAAQAISATEAENRRKAVAGASSRLTGAETAQRRASDESAAAKKAVDEAKAAAETLEKIAQTPAGTGPEQVDVARKALAKAEEELAAVKDMAKAKGLAAEITGLSAVADILAPDGLRKACLARAIAAFNENVIDPLNNLAGWQRVRIDDSLAIFYGDSAYVMASRSEKWRTRVIIQVAMAMLDGSDIIVIDDADILVGPGQRDGLVELLLGAEVPVLLGMATGSVATAPDLAAAEIGVTYFMESGVCRPLAEARAVAKAA